MIKKDKKAVGSIRQTLAAIGNTATALATGVEGIVGMGNELVGTSARKSIKGLQQQVLLGVELDLLVKQEEVVVEAITAQSDSIEQLGALQEHLGVSKEVMDKMEQGVRKHFDSLLAM